MRLIIVCLTRRIAAQLRGQSPPLSNVVLVPLEHAVSPEPLLLCCSHLVDYCVSVTLSAAAAGSTTRRLLDLFVLSSLSSGNMTFFRA